MDPPASDQSASASAPAPEPPHRVLERRIARRMVSYFSPDCGLDFDWWLLERAAKDEEGWIPIADFTSTYMRLQSLTDDEAVVAKAVRQFADNVEVSNDGKRVRSREKLLNPADPHPDDERTVYVERLPSVQANPTSLTNLFSHVGPVTRVVLPPPHPTRRGAGAGTGAGAGVGASTAGGRQRYPDPEAFGYPPDQVFAPPAGYAFVTFENAEDAQRAVVEVGRWTDLPERAVKVIREARVDGGEKKDGGKEGKGKGKEKGKVKRMEEDGDGGDGGDVHVNDGNSEEKEGAQDLDDLKALNGQVAEGTKVDEDVAMADPEETALDDRAGAVKVRGDKTENAKDSTDANVDPMRDSISTSLGNAKVEVATTMPDVNTSKLRGGDISASTTTKNGSEEKKDGGTERKSKEEMWKERVENLQAKVIMKSEWRALTAKYRAHQSSQFALLASLTSHTLPGTSPNTPALSLPTGRLPALHFAIPNPSLAHHAKSRLLRSFFALIGPVAHVRVYPEDLEGGVQGYVRFRSERDASRCVAYLASGAEHEEEVPKQMSEAMIVGKLWKGVDIRRMTENEEAEVRREVEALADGKRKEPEAEVEVANDAVEDDSKSEEVVDSLDNAPVRPKRVPVRDRPKGAHMRFSESDGEPDTNEDTGEELVEKAGADKRSGGVTSDGRRKGKERAVETVAVKARWPRRHEIVVEIEVRSTRKGETGSKATNGASYVNGTGRSNSRRRAATEVNPGKRGRPSRRENTETAEAIKQTRKRTAEDSALESKQSKRGSSKRRNVGEDAAEPSQTPKSVRSRRRGATDDVEEDHTPLKAIRGDNRRRADDNSVEDSVAEERHSSKRRSITMPTSEDDAPIQVKKRATSTGRGSRGGATKDDALPAVTTSGGVSRSGSRRGEAAEKADGKGASGKAQLSSKRKASATVEGVDDGMKRVRRR